MKRLKSLSNKFKLLYIILSFIFLLSISCKIVLSYYSSNHVYLYFNKIANKEIQLYLLYVAVISSSILLVCLLKNKTQKIVTIIFSIFLIFVISISSYGFLEADKNYFEFKSPNNKTIIVEECSWLLGGWSNVYQKTSTNIICRLDGNIITDDGYRPFSNKDFNIEWSNNSVSITYGFGNENKHKSEVFKLK